MSHAHHLIYPTKPRQQDHSSADSSPEPLAQSQPETQLNRAANDPRNAANSSQDTAHAAHTIDKNRSPTIAEYRAMLQRQDKGHAKRSETRGQGMSSSTEAMGSAGTTPMTSNEYLSRPCVDCGPRTDYCCDATPRPCFAAKRMTAEHWARNQLTPLCPTCDAAWNMCRFCRADRTHENRTTTSHALSGHVDVLAEATLRGLDVTCAAILDLLVRQPLNVKDQ